MLRVYLRTALVFIITAACICSGSCAQPMGNGRLKEIHYQLQAETAATRQGRAFVEPKAWRRIRIVSGGQTGVDQAALSFAMEWGLPCGGWCPKGRLAEDGLIPMCFPVQEADSELPRVRTELNVLDSDGTLVISTGSPQDGTPLTIELANKHGRPMYVVDVNLPIEKRAFRHWIESNEIRVLNVAGPRESFRPGFVGKRAREALDELFLKD